MVDKCGQHYLLSAMDMPKVSGPLSVGMFWHKFEHPMSTPHYFSLPLILSVTHIYVSIYRRLTGIDLGAIGQIDPNELEKSMKINACTLRIFTLKVCELEKSVVSPDSSG